MGDVFLQGGQFRIEFLAQDGQPVAVAVARLLLVRGDLQAQRCSLPRSQGRRHRYSVGYSRGAATNHFDTLSIAVAHRLAAMRARRQQCQACQ